MNKEISQRFIDIAFSLNDYLKSNMTLVDSYFGEYHPQGNFEYSFNSKIKLEDAINNLMQDIQKIISSDLKNYSLIDVSEILKTFLSLLSIDGIEKNQGYEKAIENLYHYSLKSPTTEKLENLKTEIQKLLVEMGYPNDWPKCIQKWQQENRISASEYLSILKNEANHFRELTYDKIINHLLEKDNLLSLYDLESVDYKLTNTSESWVAYHFYSGNYKSEIQVNNSGTFNRSEATVFASHEVYPGHHTESIVKEFLYRTGKLGLSSTINLLHSPACIISEGIGDYGRYFLDSPLMKNDRIAYLFDRLKTEARHRLAYLMHKNKITINEASSKLTEFLGSNPDECFRALKFAQEWKYYFPSYFIGFHLVADLFKQYHKRALVCLYQRSSLEGIRRQILN